MSTDPREALIPTAEVARRLRCDVRTVHRLVARGILTPAVQAPGLRGALLFEPQDVEDVATRRVVSPMEADLREQIAAEIIAACDAKHPPCTQCLWCARIARGAGLSIHQTARSTDGGQ